MAIEPDPETLLARIETNLARPWFRIGFDDGLEQTFQSTMEPMRVRHFTLILAVAAVMYDLFIFPHRLMMPDAFHLALLLQFGFVTPVVVCALWFLCRRKISSATAALVSISIIIAAEMAIMLGSWAPHAILIVFTIPMTLIFAAVLPLPFSCAVYLSLASVAATSLAICIHPGFDVASGLFAFAVAFCIMIFTLLAVYKLETSERRSYLLTLAEATRVTMLARDNRLLHDLSHCDGMTGLGNRRYFDVMLERLWAAQIKTGTPVALLMIDIDHFKQFNDIQGHLGGDRCIRAVADIITRLTRENTDIACRYGGDEFAILLPGPRSGEAASIAERLRAAVQIMRIEDSDRTNPIMSLSISIGHAMLMPDESTHPMALVAEADKALYRAKQVGRNRVCHHPFPEDPSVRIVA